MPVAELRPADQVAARFLEPAAWERRTDLPVSEAVAAWAPTYHPLQSMLWRALVWSGEEEGASAAAEEVATS